MDNKVMHNRNKKKFYMIIGESEGHMMYRNIDEDTLNFYHTYVPDELRGKKVAEKIVREAVEFAIEENKKIMPGCSYVKRFLERHSDYSYLMKV